MKTRVAKTLTALSVKGLQGNGTSRQEIADAALPGFYVIVQPGGSRSWALRYRLHGKPAKLTLGTVLDDRAVPIDTLPTINSPMTLAEARAVARAQMQLLQEGHDPAKAKGQAIAKAATIRTAEKEFSVEYQAAEFIKLYAKVRNPKGWAEKERQFRAEIIGNTDHKEPTKRKGPWLGKDVRELTKRDVIKLRNAIIERGSPITANRVHATLSTFFNWLVSEDVIKSNPMVGLKKQTKEKARERVLSNDEVRIFWKAASAAGYPFGDMWRLLLLTAQRRQEVAGLEWKELHLNGELPHWLIPSARSKNGRENLVPLSPSSLAIIKSIPKIKGVPFAFTTTLESSVSGFSRSKARLDAAMLAIMQDEAEARGEDRDDVVLPQWGLHDLRRTAASGMAAMRVPIHVVEKILNHTTGVISGTAAVYNRYTYEDEAREALNAWERRVLEICVGEASNVVSIRA